MNTYQTSLIAQHWQWIKNINRCKNITTLGTRLFSMLDLWWIAKQKCLPQQGLWFVESIVQLFLQYVWHEVCTFWKDKINKIVLVMKQQWSTAWFAITKMDILSKQALFSVMKVSTPCTLFWICTPWNKHPHTDESIARHIANMLAAGNFDSWQINPIKSILLLHIFFYSPTKSLRKYI